MSPIGLIHIYPSVPRNTDPRAVPPRAGSKRPSVIGNPPLFDVVCATPRHHLNGSNSLIALSLEFQLGLDGHVLVV
jgi:hypothetical protein